MTSPVTSTAAMTMPITGQLIGMVDGDGATFGASVEGVGDACVVGADGAFSVTVNVPDSPSMATE